MADAEGNQEPEVAQAPEAEAPAAEAESQQVDDAPVAADEKPDGENGDETEKADVNTDNTEQEPVADNAGQVVQEEDISNIEDGEKEVKTDSAEDVEKEAKTDSAEDGEKEANIDSAEDGEKEAKIDSAEDGEKEAKIDSAEDGEKEAKTDSAEDGEKESKTDSAEDGEKEAKTDSAEDGEKETKIDSAEDGEKEANIGSAEDGEKESKTDSVDINTDQEDASNIRTSDDVVAEDKSQSDQVVEDAASGSNEAEGSVEPKEQTEGQSIESEAQRSSVEEPEEQPAEEAAAGVEAGETAPSHNEQEPSKPEMGEKEVTEISQKEEGEGQILPPDMPSEEPTQDDLTKEKTDMSDGQTPVAKEKVPSFVDDVSMDPLTESSKQVPPAPHLPSLERNHTTIEGQMSTSALNIVWSFGLNRNVPVLNLSDGVREAIMYPCAHVGIMYDFKNNKQHTLQAHLNPITCSAISQDKRWLVTGDVGPDAMVNIWDTYTGIPIQTMFDPSAAGGVVAVAFTPDSRYLATMSSLPVQTLAIWDWTVDGDVPICSADLKPEYGVQNFIYFDPTDIHHLVTNSDNQVIFLHWEEHNIDYYAPPLSDSDFNKPVGRYTQSLFQIGIARALTATSIGNLVVWDNNRPLSSLYVKPEVYVWTGHPIMDVNQSADKKALKIIKVHDKGINVLTTTDKYIVLGDTAGHVKFFDQGLRLIYWYQDFHTGPCTAISFAYMPDFDPTPNDHSLYPSDATKQAKPFIVRNFIVGTAIAVYGNMTTDGSKFKIIHREHDSAVHALASHPKLPIIAIGSYSGLLKLWNYKTKETVGSKMFEKIHIQMVKFDPKGFFIVVGCTNGSVYILDSVALLEQLTEPYRYAREAITHIAFSHNSVYFATADAGHTITVYKRQRSRKEGISSPYIWHGRYRSHYKPIRDLLFDVYLDTNQPKLLSLGEDRMLIEYELNNHGKNHVIPKSEDRIEQSAVPRCMCMYPPITKEHFLFTANDEFKLKCYNSTTKMCRKTVLGPTYGSAISKMMVVPTMADESANRFLAYITDDKVGLHILPASGNPHLAMALIAHPSGVSNIECSFDGAYLFTAGGPDYAVHMWEINLPALEAQAKLGGEDLTPFYGLLEGGRDGDMFAELEDLFYYAQLRHQGINSMEKREIGNRIPITEVPYIMRAMGFYPSEQEIEDMLNEIKYDDFVLSGQYQVDINLGQFIKLYVNHRPAFGLAPDKLLWAFKTLADSPELGKGGIVERGDLLEILQKKGEHMTEMELAEHLTTLLGFNREGGSCEQEDFDTEQAGNFIAENLPYDIDAEIMVNEILGFSLTQDPMELPNVTDVIKSSV